MQAGGLTAWGSQYQQTVALFTTEAEYMFLARLVKQIKWMYSTMDEVGFLQSRPAVLYNDNNGAVSLKKDMKHNSHVKHIDIHHHFMHECIENREITIQYIPSSKNLADIFTKPLGQVAHHHACAMLHFCDVNDGARRDEGDEDTEHIEPGGVL